MKKALLLVSILFVSVISTACINNFAVQELNSKAQQYMQEGDYEAAIARLKSSVDLDDTIFETHYNLAVAYTENEEYNNAINSFKHAIEINSDLADTYYSLAIAESNLAVDLAKGEVRISEDGSLYKPEQSELEKETTEYKPSQEVLDKIRELNNDAIANFNIYLEKAPQATDRDEVINKIKTLREEE